MKHRVKFTGKLDCVTYTVVAILEFILATKCIVLYVYDVKYYRDYLGFAPILLFALLCACLGATFILFLRINVYAFSFLDITGQRVIQTLFWCKNTINFEQPVELTVKLLLSTKKASRNRGWLVVAKQGGHKIVINPAKIRPRSALNYLPKPLYDKCQ